MRHQWRRRRLRSRKFYEHQLAASFGFDLCGSGNRAVGKYLCRSAVLDVSRLVDERHQLEIRSQLQYRRAGAVGAAGLDLLYDLYRVEEV
jgi:hypothetical protein